jgi:hypothetical protein
MDSNNKKFLPGIPVGIFIDSDKHYYPALLPEESGGFCIFYDKENEKKTIKFIENIALQMLDAIDLGNVEVQIFDYSIRKKFNYLSMLQPYRLYNIAIDSEEANRKFKELGKIAVYRHHYLLNEKMPTISIYNQLTSFFEKYHFLIINLTDFPDDYTNNKKFIEFIDAAYESGFYLIGFGDKDILDRIDNAAVKFLIKKYPTLALEQDKLIIHNHKTTKEILRMVQILNIDIMQSTDERESIINNLIRKIQKDEQEDEKDFLSISIGTSPDGRNIINFSFGKKYGNYHAFITGLPGSGKTTLLNNIILGIAENYTAKQIRLYLMDYKEGVEFQIFENHPNVEKIFLDNKDLDASVNLLEDFVSTIDKRGEIFRAEGVKDIDTYNELHSIDPLPRIILVIDEVHRLFSGSWQDKDYFNSLLKDVAKRGRSFGVHLILSTQTLEGTDIERDIMEQITLRISFKLSSPTASEKIFTWGNTSACELGKYELIYNRDSGNPNSNIRVKTFPPKNVDEIINKIYKKRNHDECIIPKIVKSNNNINKNQLNKIKDIQNDKSLIQIPTIEFSDIDNDNTSSDKDLLAKLAEQGLIENPLEKKVNE